MTKQQDLKNEIFKVLDNLENGVFKLFVDEEDDEVVVYFEMVSIFNKDYDVFRLEAELTSAIERFYGLDTLSEVEFVIRHCKEVFVYHIVI